MLTQERHNKILELLTKQDTVTVGEVITRVRNFRINYPKGFGNFRQNGQGKKVHGGAAAIHRVSTVF